MNEFHSEHGAEQQKGLAPVMREGEGGEEGEEERGEPGTSLVFSRFLETQEYRRFIEFCEDCRHGRSIGICYGVAGVGKTLSARRYTQWDCIEPFLMTHGVVQPVLSPDNPRPRVALYTPRVTVTPRQMEHEITLLRWSLQVIGEAACLPRPTGKRMVREDQIELLVIDEADRLKPLALEVLRDLSDRSRMRIILVGMAGIEKRLARYPQFYSRVGFVHQFRALGVEEQHRIIMDQLKGLQAWRQTQDYQQDHQPDKTEHAPLDPDGIAAMIRMTAGNFRQLQQLLTQIERILLINPQVSTVSKQVVDAAREQLIFGR